MKLSMTFKVIHGHLRPPLCKNRSSTFVYEPFLMNFCTNANIMKIQFFHWIIYDIKCTFMLWRSFVILFTLRPFDLITTLTYVLVDNFCPYLFFIRLNFFEESCEGKENFKVKEKGHFIFFGVWKLFFSVCIKLSEYYTVKLVLIWIRTIYLYEEGPHTGIKMIWIAA